MTHTSYYFVFQMYCSCGDFFFMKTDVEIRICSPAVRKSPVTSPHKGQWRGALMFSFDLRLNKRLSKQSWCWWFETPPRQLWRHWNVFLELHSGIIASEIIFLSDIWLAAAWFLINSCQRSVRNNPVWSLTICNDDSSFVIWKIANVGLKLLLMLTKSSL